MRSWTTIAPTMTSSSMVMAIVVAGRIGGLRQGLGGVEGASQQLLGLLTFAL
jgi:hypothetical protein